MAKEKIHIVLPRYVAERLAAEAEAHGRSAPDLASFYVEHMLETKGLLPKKYEEKAEVPSEIWWVIEKSIKGETLNDFELAAIAEYFNKNPEVVTLLRNKSMKADRYDVSSA
jgi:hypothetical protein